MNALRNHGQGIDETLLQYLSPLGCWEIQAVATAAERLTCFKFRFLRRPPAGKYFSPKR